MDSKRSEDPDWKGCSTLEEWVVSMIERKLTETPEFQAALQVWGRDRFVKIWKDYLQSKEGKDVP